MSESLDQEIRTLQSIFWSDRDPDGLAFASLADAFRRKGQLREALDLLTDGTSRHPEYATGHVVATRLYVDQGMHAEAEFAARRVLDLDAGNVTALSAMVTVLHAQGQDSEAARMRTELVAADPDSDEARAAGLLPLPDEVPGTEAVHDEAGVADAEPSPEPPDLVDALGALGLESDTDEPVADDALGLNELELVEVTAPDAPWPEPTDGPGGGEDVPSALDSLGLRAEEAEFVDLDALGPGDEASVEAVASAQEGQPAIDVDFDPMIDLGGVVPDESVAGDPPVMDLAGLAPDEPAVDEPVMELAGLAPDEPAVEEPVMDLAGLAPDEPAVDEPVMDLAGWHRTSPRSRSP